MSLPPEPTVLEALGQERVVLLLSALCMREVLGPYNSDKPFDIMAVIREVRGSGVPIPKGDGGKARGPFQIHRAYWKDAMGEAEKDWPYEDAEDWEKAGHAVLAYLKRYGDDLYRASGNPPSAHTLARIHNGGPRGWKKVSSIGYADDVQHIIDKAEEAGGIIE